MKINLHSICISCSTPKNGTLAGYYKDFEIRDDNFYLLECPNGHKTEIWIRNQKFEILFDFGALSLIDGYTREAVASFAAALERFYEFYINVLCLKYKISDEEFLKSWKLVSNQSERQLGAFIFLYLIANKNTLDFHTISKNVEFRNKVIHKGYIPSYDEAFKYGDTILNFINDHLKELKNTNKEFLIEAINKSSSNKVKVNESDARIMYRLETIIGFFEQNQDLILKCEAVKNYSLSSEIKRIENQKRKKGFVYSFIDFLKDNPTSF